MLNDELPILKKNWNLCVGSERMVTMLRSEYWERFDEVQSVLQFKFIRCHGLLCDDMGILRFDEWNGKKRVFYNFTYLDQVFDTMREHGCRPFLELGFMPTALASGTNSVFWWEGNVTPPSDWSLWSDLLDAVFSHLIERYGAQELRLWPVEVWNEPNLEKFWQDANKENYFRLYEVSVKTIKAIDERIRVGGPAICGGSDHWIEDFLSFVHDKDLPLDFFSRHLYSGLTPTLQSPDVLYQYLSKPSRLIEDLRSVRERIDKAGFAGLELYITEFNTSYHPLCPVHDTPLNAAYLARILSESGDFADMLSYWTSATCSRSATFRARYSMAASASWLATGYRSRHSTYSRSFSAWASSSSIATNSASPPYAQTARCRSSLGIL